MARVDKLERRNIERNSLHEPASCSYSVFSVLDGKKILQIDSFGSKNREIPGKKSQTLQFTEETARQLMEIIKNEVLK